MSECTSLRSCTVMTDSLASCCSMETVASEHTAYIANREGLTHCANSRRTAVACVTLLCRAPAHNIISYPASTGAFDFLRERARFSTRQAETIVSLTYSKNRGPKPRPRFWE